jgi:hypothetical protein
MIKLGLTDEEIERQDEVDNDCLALLQGLAPFEAVILWDINIIGQVRDMVEDILVNQLKVMTKQEFYPSIKDEEATK